MDVWYSPGTWLGLSGPAVHVLADLDPASPVVAEWSTAIQAGGGPDDLLAVLMGHGLGAVPSFALCGARPDGVRVVLRGDARAWLTDGRELSAEGAPTWRDGIVGLESVPIRMGGPHPATSAARLPLAGGVVLAASVDLYLRDAVVKAPTAPVSTSSPAPAATVPPASAVATATPSAAAAEPVGHPVDTPSDPPVEPAVVDTPPDVPETAGSASADYSHLFAPSTARPVPQEPARPDVAPAPQDTLASRPEPDLVPPLEDASEPPVDGANREAVAAHEAAGPTGVISAFPWEGGAPTTPPQPAPPAPATVGRDDRPPADWSAPDLPHPSTEERFGASAGPDHTVARSALPPTPAPVGPTVLAAYCPAGHLSPVHAQQCRVCDRPVPPHQQPMTIPRPVLGVLRLPGGQTIPLDRSVLLGRAPVPHEHTPAAEQPHAVSLASPDKDVSRNHVEIRLDGWHVLAVDLGSVNGTVVVLPGRPPQRLRPEEPVILERGADVVLADEVTVTFEVPA